MNTSADPRMVAFHSLIPTQQIEALRRMLDEGMTPATVARAAGMSLEALQSVLAACGDLP